MISFDTFKESINLLNTLRVALDNFNNGMSELLGSDSSSMFYAPLNIAEMYVISILQNEFGESEEGAEWFIYEGLEQIAQGGTVIEYDGKKWNIDNIEDYYNYLVSLKNI